jgi:uncharacterized membrane protein YccC
MSAAGRRVTLMWQQAARLGKAVVPDWLTEVVPDWLVAAVRPKRAPVPWADMIRAAFAICVPLSAGIVVHQRVTGLLMAMGGLLGIVVDNGGPFVARIKRVGSAAVFGGAVGLAIGSLIHGHGWIAVLALVVVAGVSALLSAINDVGSVTGLQLLIYSSFGLGPLGALRPWWHTALGFVLGTAWALLLTVPGWLLAPRAAEQRSVAAVYHGLARQLHATGSPGYGEGRRAVTGALNTAYDAVLTARSTAGGRNKRMQWLVILLNQSNLIAEAATALNREGTRPPPAVATALDQVADVIEDGGKPPVIPAPPGTSPGTVTLRDALAGLPRVLSGDWTPPTASARSRRPWRDRLAEYGDRMTSRLTRRFAIRLMTCIGVAGVLSEVLPLQRSYWLVLTVAIVLKPDFGSVFARAVQRGLGTVVGAVLGAVIIIVVPYGPWLLLPFAALAAMLPYGRSRNFGLMAVFLTPLVVVLIDLLSPGGWRLAEARLLDTLLACAVVLLVGYAPWPTSWHAQLPGQLADTIRDVCRYAEVALAAPGDGSGQPAAGGGGGGGGGGSGSGSGGGSGGAGGSGASRSAGARLPARSRLRRRAYRSVSDLRAEFDRTMSEPRAVSRGASAWWPALAGLDEVVETVTASMVAIGHGAPAPDPAAVRQLTGALGRVADAVQARVAPSGDDELPSDEALKPVIEAVRAVLGVLASRKQPPDPHPDGARSDGAGPDGARPDGARPDGARPDAPQPADPRP